MTESAFRTQLNTWRNSLPSSNPEVANSSTSFFSKLNPFNSENGYSIRLPVSEREELEEPSWFTLSRWDRLLVFGFCLVGAALCFGLCFAILPILALNPRKFALLWTLGSLLFVISFGVLQGPVAYMKHLISSERLPFTVAYFGSIAATLEFSIGLKSILLTLLAVIVQVIAALWYTVSYFPMGSQSLKFASRIGARQVTSWINS